MVLAVTACVIHQDHEADEDWLCCRRAWGRLAGSLRRIPELCEELAGLGYVQRDTGLRVRAEVRYENTRKSDVADEGFPDPVAYALPAGPLNGRRSGPRVSSTPDPSIPIAVDVTDLLGPARHGSLPVADRSRWPEDQTGFLSAATILDFWARDWADLRGERPPDLRSRDRSLVANVAATSHGLAVGILCSWLLDRLDWACQRFAALDEFARDIQELSSALYGLNGHGPARPKLMEATCPGCTYTTLVQYYPEANIECLTEDCGRILTPEEYAEHVRSLIEENS